MKLEGIGVSPGIAVGPALIVEREAVPVFRLLVPPEAVGGEVERLTRAVEASRQQLKAIKERLRNEVGVHAYIFDAHLLMLEDSKLNGDVEAVIRGENVNSEWAVKVVTDRLLAVYEEIKDDYLRERSSDIEDVTRRLLVALSGGSMLGRRLTEDAVVVAEELMPSTLAELDFTHIKTVWIGVKS